MPPQLLWAGKSESDDVEVDAVSVHILRRTQACPPVAKPLGVFVAVRICLTTLSYSARLDMIGTFRAYAG